jgi:hypothetical protein
MYDISYWYERYELSDRNERWDRCLDTRAAVIDKLKRQKKDGSQAVP